MKNASFLGILSYLLVFVFIIIQGGNVANACTPVLRTSEELFAQADAVFWGQVHDVKSVSGNDNTEVSALIDVQIFWKGNPRFTQKIKSTGIYTCAPGFNKDAEGKFYLVYANYDATSTTYLVPSFQGMVKQNAQEVEKTLGKGTAIPVSMPTVYPSFQYDLTLGSTGTDVVRLQSILEKRGFLTIPVGVTKGYFGPLTKSAVIKYQISKGIKPAAGYFGPLTRKSIDSAD